MHVPQLDLEPASTTNRERVRTRLDRLAKPPGSLGRLEHLAVRLAGMQHRARPRLDQPRVVIFAASHAVADNHSVSAYPPETTARVVEAFCNGSAAVNALADRADLPVDVVDLGVEGLSDDLTIDEPNVTVRRPSLASPGARDLVDGPAAPEETATQALEAGLETARRADAGGADAICLGDVGIGNTTSAAAVAARLLDRSPSEMTGPGSGLDADGVDHKAGVVERALSRSTAASERPLEVLADLGGPDYLAMAGCCLGAAQRHIPVILDGYIVSTAALGAVGTDPSVADYLLPATLSAEPGHRAVLEAMDVGEPLLDWSLRLGEASAATLVVPLLRSACAVVDQMATLDEVITP
ncbi:MAG: nicotinate-nucleotide--dimethylbenzimidazole phosphoribosyltransferase [Bradymonadaceae bacterium]